MDRALNAARSLLFTAHAPDAAVPVLFVRLKDGRRLFTPEDSAASDVPFMADDLPLDFVVRPNEFEALMDAMRAEEAVALVGASLVSALGLVVDDVPRSAPLLGDHKGSPLRALAARLGE